MDIFVYAHWAGMDAPTLMGTLSATHTKGRELFSFAYEKSWLDSAAAQVIDPELQLFTGPQYLSNNRKNFGIFLDSSPDRWGRVLMDRREALLAKKEERKRRNLFEEDYLLGVFDAHRMGALRFKVEKEAPFLNDNKGLAAPPWTTLRELEHASLKLEEGALQDEESLKWINLLIAPGASLGGARPKASVLDEKNNLWIAKFPSVNDKTDVGAWEMVAHQLAQKSSIVVSDSRVRRFNSRHHSFLSKRFDRQEDKRLHFASAMTLLGYSDGAEGVSYLELAEFIMQQGAQVNADLEELWRRIVFNIAIKNTDDHLRNHGFISTRAGWTLSPAYDVNPVYFGKGLTLNISETDNSLDFDVALSVAKYFRVAPKRANEIVLQIKKSVEGWREIAMRYNIPREEQELMESAFNEELS